MLTRHKVLLAIATPPLLVAVVAGVFAWRCARADRALEAEWRQRLGGATFLERFPANSENRTVLELEALGAEIGLALAPYDSGRNEPTSEAAARFAEIKERLPESFTEARQGLEGLVPEVPEPLLKYLEYAQPTLDRMATVLLTGEPPRWYLDLHAGLDTPLPNYLGILALARLFLNEAWRSLEMGEPERANHLLEASWRLTAATLDRPDLFGQLIGRALVKLDLIVLRSRPGLSDVWLERLTELDLQERVTLAFTTESYLLRQLGKGESDRKHRFLYDLIARDSASRLNRMIGEAEAIPAHEFDPEAFVQLQLERIPRWNIPARLLVPDHLDAWPRAGHVELAAELTVLAELERRRLARGERRPSRAEPSAQIAGLLWRYELQSGGTRIFLEGQYRYPGRDPLRLEVMVFGQEEDLAATSR